MKKIIGILSVFIISIALVIPANAQFATGCLLSTFTPWCYEGSAAKTSPSITQILAPDGTAAAPGMAFGGEAGTGYSRSLNQFAMSVNGIIQARLDSSGRFVLRDSLFIGASDASLGSTLDTILARDAANTLALRNAANAQEFRVYNKFTDGATNEEWLAVSAINLVNQFTIEPENIGGTLLGLNLVSATGTLTFFRGTPVARQAANADTTAATLANLEIEVNQLKQLLRNYNLMAP